MRILLLSLLLSFSSFFISCSSESDSTNNSGNTFTNSMDYEFTITINGEVHKVKGNTTDGIPTGTVNSAIHNINNSCVANDYGAFDGISLAINDVTTSNYISGQNFRCFIQMSNLLLGINQAEISFQGSYFDSLVSNLGGVQYGQGFMPFQTISGPQNQINQNKLPITITDLGTGTIFPQTPPLPYYNFGQTLKGNYSGIIYVRRQIATSPYLIYDIPVQLSIDFKALRMY